MLRNIGIRNARTQFVFNLDVDFIVSENAHEYLQAHIRRVIKPPSTLAALVVVAFESDLQELQIPRTKQSVLTAQDHGTVMPISILATYLIMF